MGAKKKDGDKPSRSVISSDRNARAMEVRDWFNKTFAKNGRGELMEASKYAQPWITRRLPTGLLTLDIALKGGWASGGINQIKGPKNSGKNYLAWQTVRQLQHMLGDKLMVLLAMTEFRADRSQARAAGVEIAYADEDIESIRRARSQSGFPDLTPEEISQLKNQIGTFHELHGESAEVLYETILKCVSHDVYHLIIIDSFGGIVSEAEAEAEMGQKSYGGSSGVNTQFLRKLTSSFTMNNPNTGEPTYTCILGLNQIRDNIGNQWQQFRTPGGRMLEHQILIDLFVQSGRRVDVEVEKTTTRGREKVKVQTGKEINWVIEKGKAGMHEGDRGSYIFDFGDEERGAVNRADFYQDTLVAGLNTGVISQSGNWLTLNNDVGEVLISENGKANFLKVLWEDSKEKAAKGDPESFMNLIRQKALQNSGISIDYDWED